MNLGTEQICLVGVFAVALLILVVNDRIKERLVRKKERQGQRPPRQYLNYITSWWLVLALLGTAVLMAGLPKPPDNFGLATPIKLAYAALAIAGAVVLVVSVLIRKKRRTQELALQKAQQGDVAGAITLLEQYLAENEPSAGVYNDLAVFQGVQGKWKESLELIEQAELHGGPVPLYLANKGLALWKLGRREDALPLLKEAAQRSRSSLTVLCNYGSLLAELGHVGEARTVLRKADQLFAKHSFFQPASERRRQEEMLEAFRRLVADLGSKTSGS